MIAHLPLQQGLCAESPEKPVGGWSVASSDTSCTECMELPETRIFLVPRSDQPFFLVNLWACNWHWAPSELPFTLTRSDSMTISDHRGPRDVRAKTTSPGSYNTST